MASIKADRKRTKTTQKPKPKQSVNCKSNPVVSCKPDAQSLHQKMAAGKRQ